MHLKRMQHRCSKIASRIAEAYLGGMRKVQDRMTAESNQMLTEKATREFLAPNVVFVAEDKIKLEYKILPNNGMLFVPDQHIILRLGAIITAYPELETGDPVMACVSTLATTPTFNLSLTHTRHTRHAHTH